MTLDEMKEKKIQMGYSCEQIAKLSQVPLGTVQKIFSGITRTPRYETLRALERVFSTEISEENPEYVRTCMMRESRTEYHVERKPGDYTLEDYYAIPEERRVELIDGVIYDIGAPSMIHQMLCGEIWRALREYIMEKKGRCIAVQSPADVQLDCNDKTIVQPDVFVICDREKILRHCLYGAPDLVVEILSKATRKKDMGIKQAKYMNAGVREYWIVDPDARKIVVYDLEQEKLPVIYGFGDSVPVRIFQGECVIDFAQIYGYIRFLYEK